MSQLAVMIADRLMFLNGINKPGTMLVPGIAAFREEDEVRGGSYNREEVVRAIDEVIVKEQQSAQYAKFLHYDTAPGAANVGELKQLLGEFPDDMPIDDGVGVTLQVVLSGLTPGVPSLFLRH